jgi:hypothetical protein
MQPDLSNFRGTYVHCLKFKPGRECLTTKNVMGENIAKACGEYAVLRLHVLEFENKPG